MPNHVHDALWIPRTATSPMSFTVGETEAPGDATSFRAVFRVIDAEGRAGEPFPVTVRCIVETGETKGGE